MSHAASRDRRRRPPRFSFHPDAGSATATPCPSPQLPGAAAPGCPPRPRTRAWPARRSAPAILDPAQGIDVASPEPTVAYTTLHARTAPPRQCCPVPPGLPEATGPCPLTRTKPFPVNGLSDRQLRGQPEIVAAMRLGAPGPTAAARAPEWESGPHERAAARHRPPRYAPLGRGAFRPKDSQNDASMPPGTPWQDPGATYRTILARKKGHRHSENRGCPGPSARCDAGVSRASFARWRRVHG